MTAKLHHAFVPFTLVILGSSAAHADSAPIVSCAVLQSRADARETLTPLERTQLVTCHGIVTGPAKPDLFPVTVPVWYKFDLQSEKSKSEIKG